MMMKPPWLVPSAWTTHAAANIATKPTSPKPSAPCTCSLLQALAPSLFQSTLAATNSCKQHVGNLVLQATEVIQVVREAVGLLLLLPVGRPGLPARRIGL
eukprot:12888780-Prorocentrum_lima.AAC.1